MRQQELKKLGLVRRLDSAVRFSIPNELRTHLGWKAGDPVELYMTEDGDLLLRRFSALKGLDGLGDHLVRSLHEVIRVPVLLADRDVVVAVAGGSRDYLGRPMPAFMAKSLDTGLVYNEKGSAAVPVVAKEYVAGVIGAYSFDGELDPGCVAAMRAVALFAARYLHLAE